MRGRQSSSSLGLAARLALLLLEKKQKMMRVLLEKNERLQLQTLHRNAALFSFRIKLNQTSGEM